MPMAMEWTDSEFLSNSMTATVFAAVHYSSANKIPWPQFAMGWYLGWVAQRNDWTLSESIFIHTWWDVIIFLTEWSFTENAHKSMYLPIFEIPF